MSLGAVFIYCKIAPASEHTIEGRSLRSGGSSEIDGTTVRPETSRKLSIDKPEKCRAGQKQPQFSCNQTRHTVGYWLWKCYGIASTSRLRKGHRLDHTAAPEEAARSGRGIQFSPSHCPQTKGCEVSAQTERPAAEHIHRVRVSQRPRHSISNYSS